MRGPPFAPGRAPATHRPPFPLILTFSPGEKGRCRDRPQSPPLPPGEGRGEGDCLFLYLQSLQNKRMTGTKAARKLRKQLTDAERVLWRALRSRGLHGLKFRRQHPIGPYVADFACLEAALVVELDGGQHAWQQSSDNKRCATIEAAGFRVVRVWNNDVLTNLPGVLENIVSVAVEQGAIKRDAPSS